MASSCRSAEASSRKLFSFISRLGLLVVVSTVVVGCGGSPETTLVKDYRLVVIDNDPAIKDQFRRLVSDFNDFVGQRALSYTDDVTTANSRIILTSGLKQRDGKVGWGQWISESTTEATFLARTSVKTVKYRMALEI